MDRKKSHTATKNRFLPYPPSSSSKKKTSTSVQSKSSPRNNTLSVNELKRRIRDVKRLLSHADLPADARIVQERALMGYEADLKTETERRRRSEMIKKYHFVRFLDRKTATKEYKRLLRKYQELTGQPYSKDELHASQPPEKASRRAAVTKSKKTTNEITILENRIQEARINMNYTIYYPLTEKYISLYPHKKRKSDGDIADKSSEEEDHGEESENDLLAERDTTTTERPPMYEIVEKCTKNGTLDLLREGKLNVGADGIVRAGTPSAKESSSTIKSKSSKAPASTMGVEANARHKAERTRYERSLRGTVDNDDFHQEEEESDGGFFEE